MPEMHDIDRSVLQRLVGKPDLSEKLMDLYFRLQRARHRASIPGNMDLASLSMMALMSGDLELPKAVSCKFGHLKEGDRLEFRINDFEWHTCMFVQVRDADAHTYDVIIDGELRTMREGQLREKAAPPVVAGPVSATKSAAEQVDPAPEDRIEAPEIDPEEIVLKVTDDEKQLMLDNLRKQFPKGTPVEVVPDGGASVNGVVSHCGAGPLLGKVAVKVAGEKTFKWFRSCDVFVNEEALATAGA